MNRADGKIIHKDVGNPRASIHVGSALVGVDTTVFRRDAERIIDKTPGHPLKFLLDKSGHFKRTRGLTHAELANRPDLVQMGHVTSNKSGGQELIVLQDAWQNQFDNITIEHPARGGALRMSMVAVDIGGIAVDIRTARMWENLKFLRSGTVNEATHIPF